MGNAHAGLLHSCTRQLREESGLSFLLDTEKLRFKAIFSPIFRASHVIEADQWNFPYGLLACMAWRCRSFRTAGRSVSVIDALLSTQITWANSPSNKPILTTMHGLEWRNQHENPPDLSVCVSRYTWTPEERYNSRQCPLNNYTFRIYFRHWVWHRYFVTSPQTTHSSKITLLFLSEIESPLSITNLPKMAARCGWFWSIVWFLILLIFGFAIGLLCAVLYVLFSPFAACCTGCTEFINLLERGVKLPLTCATNMVTQKSPCNC
jgi:hypothetical protein